LRELDDLCWIIGGDAGFYLGNNQAVGKAREARQDYKKIGKWE
jgi:hypothetical protein